MEMKNKERYTYIFIIILLISVLINIMYNTHKTISKLDKINIALYQQLIAADKVINSIDDNYFLDILVETDEYQEYIEILNKEIE